MSPDNKANNKAGNGAGGGVAPLVDLFHKPADLDPTTETETETETETDLAGDPDTAHRHRPRGLTGQGLVRTTGWLHAGTQPVNSGLITTVICLLLALVAGITLLPVYPMVSGLCLLLLPAAGYGLWRLVTTRIAPASTAHNISTITADQLQTGTWIRLHGTIGPLGHVAHVHPQHPDPPSTEDHTDTVHVTFTGGTTMTWPSNHQLHIAELHN